MNITKLNKKRIIINILILNVVLLIAFLGISFLVYKFSFNSQLSSIKEKQQNEIFGIRKILIRYYGKDDEMLLKYLTMYEDRIPYSVYLYVESGDSLYPVKTSKRFAGAVKKANGFFYSKDNLVCYENFKIRTGNNKSFHKVLIFIENSSINYLKICEFRRIILKGLALYLIIAYILSMLVLIISRINYDKFQTRIFGDLIKHTNDGVIITDAEGYVAFANDSFINMFKVKLKEVLGQKISKFNSFLHDEEYFKGMLGRLNREGSWEGEVINSLSDGSKLYTKLKITSIENKKSKEHYNICIYENKTQMKLDKIDVLKLQLYDSYTGLPNKTYARKYLEKLVGCSADFVYININILNFKAINDAHGCEVGNKLLMQFIEKVKDILGYDIFISRVDGRKIGITAELTSLKDFWNRIQELKNISKNPFNIFADQIFVETGLAIALLPEENLAVVELMELECKPIEEYLRGENAERICSGIVAKCAKIESFIEQLGTALENDEFSLSYQPRVETTNDHIVGAEALIRWDSKVLGTVSPLYFIPIAEKNGFIEDISKWTVKELCRQLSAWEKETKDLIPVSLNISPIYLQSGSFVPLLKEELEKNNLASDKVQIELSERTLNSSCETVKAHVNELAELGVSVMVDNFGTGNSKLDYLENLDISTLKIDREFIKNFPEYDDGSIAKLITDMAKALQIGVVGEGAENREQINFLKECGCYIVQGYFYSKPLPADKFKEAMIKKTIQVNSY